MAQARVAMRLLRVRLSLGTTSLTESTARTALRKTTALARDVPLLQ